MQASLGRLWWWYPCTFLSPIQMRGCNCRAKMGKGPKPLPIWLGNILAAVLLRLGPKGLEFGRYSLDYHTIRNWLYVKRTWGDKVPCRIPALTDK